MWRIISRHVWLRCCSSRRPVSAGRIRSRRGRSFARDRYKHASPNSAQTEAAAAGALHVQLAGDAWYFGELHKKPFIGDDLRPIEPEDITRVNRMMYAAAVLALVVFGGLKLALLLRI